MISYGVWLLGNSKVDIATSVQEVIFFNTVLTAGISLFLFAIVIFVYQFTKEKQAPQLLILLYGLNAIASIFLAPTEYAFSDIVIPDASPVEELLGPLWVSFLLFYFVGHGLMIRWLRQTIRESRGKRRNQARYMLIGLLIAATGGIFFDIILPVFGELRFYNLGPQFGAAFLGCTGYALFRHRLLDSRIAIRRSVRLLSTSFGVICLYTILFYTVELLLSQQSATLAIQLSAILLICLALCVLPIILFWVHQSSYTRELDRLHFLQHLTEALASTHAYDDVITVATPIIAAQFQSQTHITDTSHSHVALTVPIPSHDTLTLQLSDPETGRPFSRQDEETLTLAATIISLSLSRFGVNESHAQQIQSQHRAAQLQLIQDISHEVQTPLTVLQGHLELLTTTGPSITAPLTQSVQQLSHAMKRMLHLATLRYEEDITTTPVSLSALIHDVVEYVNVIAAQDGTTISTTIEDGIMMDGNEAQLRELITNILSNAMKYIDNERHISVSLKRANNHILIRVTDTGSGIPETHIAQLLGRHTRHDHHRELSGTGLGLAICTQITKAHNGTLEIDSTVGVGTTVTVSFPISSPH